MIDQPPTTPKMLRGHYSLIQFCPDAARLEVANIGVALYCAERDYFGLKLSNEHRRIAQMFGRGDWDRGRLRTSKSALQERLLDPKREIRNLDDLNRLAALQVNQIRMTPFMPCRITNHPEEELSLMFHNLVGTSSSPAPREKKLFPTLERFFTRLESEGRAELDFKAKLPVFGQIFKVPFAYRNGVLNLVKPKCFSEKAPQQALDLAIRGDLIKKHGLEDAADPTLVVVSKFPADCDPDFILHVDEVFREYHVKHVRQADIEDFVKAVDAEAHA